MTKYSSKHFLDLDKINGEELNFILDLAYNIKNNKTHKNSFSEILRNKSLAMIFEKSSTRTRVSFEVAINQLGGNSIVMNKNDMQLSKGEEVSDTAQVLSRYVDGIIIRSNLHDTVTELANYSNVPVINALSDFSHPCQIMASLLTIKEKIGSLANKKLVWYGEQNNVLNSYIHAAITFNYNMVIASPKNMDFSLPEINKANQNGAKITIENDPIKAAIDADVIITDTWFSMGDTSLQNEELKKQKIELLKPYQVNSEVMKLAKKDAIFTHCLPAYRGYEVSSEVIDSKNSVIFDEAENRLHAQKAILAWLYQ